MFLIPFTIILVIFRPELLPGLIKGLVGGFATATIMLLTLLQANIPAEIAWTGSIVALVAIFLMNYLPDRIKDKQENSLPAIKE
jgi:hypothetical protein